MKNHLKVGLKLMWDHHVRLLIFLRLNLIRAFFPRFARRFEIQSNDFDMRDINLTIEQLEATGEPCQETIVLSDGNPLTIKIEEYDCWVGGEGGGGCIKKKRRIIEY